MTDENATVNKVWIVTEQVIGKCIETRVIGVATTLQLAKQMSARLPLKNEQWFRVSADVYTNQLDTHSVVNINVMVQRVELDVVANPRYTIKSWEQK